MALVAGLSWAKALAEAARRQIETVTNDFILVAMRALARLDSIIPWTLGAAECSAASRLRRIAL